MKRSQHPSPYKAPSPGSASLPRPNPYFITLISARKPIILQSSNFWKTWDVANPVILIIHNNSSGRLLIPLACHFSRIHQRAPLVWRRTWKSSVHNGYRPLVYVGGILPLMRLNEVRKVSFFPSCLILSAESQIAHHTRIFSYISSSCEEGGHKLIDFDYASLNNRPKEQKITKDRRQILYPFSDGWWLKSTSLVRVAS